MNFTKFSTLIHGALDIVDYLLNLQGQSPDDEQ